MTRRDAILPAAAARRTAGLPVLVIALGLTGCAAWRSDPAGAASPKEAVTSRAASSTAPSGITPPPDSKVATVQAGAAAQQFSGRLSLRVHQPRSGATDGGTILFDFEGNSEEGRLVLQTVIGTAVATARWNPQGAEIVTPRGRHEGAQLDDVATALLGQSLPLAAILHWVRAQPWNRAPHEPRVEGFEQLGWSISLEAWHERVVTAHRRARADHPGDLEITVRARLDDPADAER